MSLDVLFDLYLKVILEFLFEIYIFYFLITRKLKKRENFGVRFIIGSIVLLLFCFLITIFYSFYGDTALGRVLVYTSIFGFTIIHLYYCYDESIWSIILCSTLGYALQNLVYKVFLFIWTA